MLILVSQDAEDVVNNFNGKSFMGSTLVFSPPSRYKFSSSFCDEVSLLSSPKKVAPVVTPTTTGTVGTVVEIVETVVLGTHAHKRFCMHVDAQCATRSSRARRPPGVRVIVTDVSRDTSWQVRGLLSQFFPAGLSLPGGVSTFSLPGGVAMAWILFPLCCNG